jgi:hypothetical protein
VRGGASSVPGGVFKTPGGVFKTPGGVFKIPGGVFKTPGGVFKVPGGVFKVPGGVFKVPGGCFKVPGGCFKVPGGVLKWKGDSLGCAEGAASCGVGASHWNLASGSRLVAGWLATGDAPLVLRLVHSGTPQASGRGWLELAGVLQLLVGVLWLLSLWRSLSRGLLDEETPGAVAHVVGWGVYGLLMVSAAIFVWRRRRWAWRLSIGLGTLCLVLGFVGGGSAPIMVGSALCGALWMGRDAIGQP